MTFTSSNERYPEQHSKTHLHWYLSTL